uniref:Bone morphogenetic protein Bmp5-8 n=1 Tax=Meara stichopi TaxID=84115 RepID=A0A2P1DVB0_9BILA|nr:bone morphogenetic protein Bmp5-8 [Meara stichopi]
MKWEHLYVYFCSINIAVTIDIFIRTGNNTVEVDPLTKETSTELENDLLILLGLDSIPKTRTPGSIISGSDFMVEAYKKLANEQKINQFHGDDNTVYRPTDKSISMYRILDWKVLENSDLIVDTPNTVKLNYNTTRRGMSQLYMFHISNVPAGLRLTKCELRVYRNWLDLTRGEYMIVSVHQVVKVKDKAGILRKQLKFLSDVVLGSNDRGWIVFDVKLAVLDWLLHHNSNYGIKLSVKSAKWDKDTIDIVPTKTKLDSEIAGFVGSEGPADRQPFIISYFVDDDVEGSKQMKLKRVRRSARRSTHNVPREDISNWSTDRHQRYSQNSVCQLKSLYVSFADLQWDEWIIAPPGFMSNYCAGKCVFPIELRMNATNHAVIQTLYDTTFPDKLPPTQCAPSELAPINVLYYDDKNNVVLQKYKNMVVRWCGCH